MSAVLDVVSAVLLLTGAALCLLAAVGLLVFPDTVSRLHAAAKGQTLGVLLVLLGTAAQLPARYAVALLLVILFQMTTAPVTGQIIGRTAYRTGAVEPGRLVVDELAERLAADERRRTGED